MINYKKILESVLFVAAQPLGVKELSALIGLPEAETEGILRELEEDYAERGIRICRVAGGYQFRTVPETSVYVSRFLEGAEEVRLTPASLETLAVIAYKQPCSRIQVDNIRGVISDSALETLLKRGLIEEAGRAESVGRPILFRTTERFLKEFGLHSLKDLPLLPAGPAAEEAFKEGQILPPSQAEIFDEQHRSAVSPGL
jgi:segregation and condensation protein B